MQRQIVLFVKAFSTACLSSVCVCEAGKELRIRRVGSSGGLWNKGCQVVVANDLERLQKCHRSSKVAKEMERDRKKKRDKGTERDWRRDLNKAQSDYVSKKSTVKNASCFEAAFRRCQTSAN